MRKSRLEIEEVESNPTVTNRLIKSIQGPIRLEPEIDFSKEKKPRWTKLKEIDDDVMMAVQIGKTQMKNLVKTR